MCGCNLSKCFLELVKSEGSEPTDPENYHVLTVLEMAFSNVSF